MKPILFNTEMVKAILEGRKTTTRRIVKRTPSNDTESGYVFWKDYNEDDGKTYIKDYTHSCCWIEENEYISKYSKYKVGDILYVRETWCRGKVEIEDTTDGFQGETYISQCIGDEDIFLKVKSVRVEKLQDITEEGCLEEGIRKYTKDGELFKYSVNESMYKWQDMPKEPKEAFKDLWNSTLNKKTGWNYKYENNPYVWVIEFERISKEEINE